jgi:hypothetical protein
MDRIADIGIAEIAKRICDGQHMTLDVSPLAKACIAERGYDVRYGARPLKRALVREILNPMSRLVLEGTVRDGDIVQVRTRGEALKLQKEGEAELGWATGSNHLSEDKNDVVILKNHEAYPEEDNSEKSAESDSDWDFDDDLRA